jgi:hypothetical protein
MNEKLQALSPVIGEWTTIGTHPMLPGRTFHGHATFDWIESGGFLRLRSTIEEPEIPDGVAIFGTDDATPNAGAMIYFDVRGVAREYRWTVAGNTLRWSRTSAEFSQRLDLTISDDGRHLAWKGEMSRDGSTWEPDLELTFTRMD